MASVLTGSHATRKRHLRQAKAIQAAIANRWHRENPWTWQQKHLEWFLTMQTHQNAQTTRSYYLRTARLVVARLGRHWQLKAAGKVGTG